MLCEPPVSEDVVQTALPAPSVAVQPGIALPLSRKVTVPVGVPELPITIAVKVTLWPALIV